MSEYMNLSDLQGGAPRPHISTTTIDLTGGKGAVINGTPQGTAATPIQTGPVDPNNLRSVDINSILPKRAETPNAFETKLMDDLDMAIDREMNRITEFHQELADKQEEEMMAAAEAAEEAALEREDEFAISGTAANTVDEDNLFDDEEDEDEADVSFLSRKNPKPYGVGTDVAKDAGNFVATNTTTVEPAEVSVSASTNVVEEAPIEVVAAESTVVEPAKKSISILANMSDDDLFEDDDYQDENTAPASVEESEIEPENKLTSEEILDELKVQIKERITPVNKSFDLSKFTIAKKAISAQKVMKLATEQFTNVADWVMPCAGRPVSASGLSGPEIIKLNPENTTRNRQNTFRDMYRIIYDHIVDGNKPEFEVWLKQTRFVDVQHIYFALYKATFAGSNFVNYACPKCSRMFIKDYDFEDMVAYADDETKESVKNMLKMDTTSPSKDSYDVELVQVSPTYVLAIRTPSIWSVIMETASLSDAFLEKHADLIDKVAYIDGAYVIDVEHQQLIPVDTKPVANDMAKTAGRRIKAMSEILQTLTSEEYYALAAKINEYDSGASKISYKIPGTTCPHCNTEIPEQTERVTAEGLLFTHHQLVAIGNM